MKTATVRELRKELEAKSSKALIELCLRLAKFKKENKELLTYLLYEAADEVSYVKTVKAEMTLQFEAIQQKSYYQIKKAVRKILRQVKKYIRYSPQKETEVELLLFYCELLNTIRPSIHRYQMLKNLYDRQLLTIQKTIAKLHEDLQYDYQLELEALQRT